MRTVIDFLERGTDGDYSYGVSLFKRVATPGMIKRYGGFLEKAGPGIGLPMLKAKLRAMVIAIRTEPERFPQVDLSGKKTEGRTEPEDDDGLTGRVDDLEDGAEGLAGRMEDIENDVEGLKEKVGELGKPGVRVTEISGLPPDLQVAYRRVKAMVPRMAYLHAELFLAKNDEERKALAGKLCRMDESRRELWRRLDEWHLAGGGMEDAPVKRAVALQRRRKRCMQNILSALRSVERYGLEPDKALALRAAEERLERYNEELRTLNEMVGGKGHDERGVPGKV